jgi:hypothetical protein
MYYRIMVQSSLWMQLRIVLVWYTESGQDIFDVMEQPEQRRVHTVWPIQQPYPVHGNLNMIEKELRE